jgi:hypothetical protein
LHVRKLNSFLASVFTTNSKTNSQQNNDGMFALVAASEAGVLPEIPAAVQSTVWVAKLVIAMTAFAMNLTPETAAHANATGIAAHATIALHAWNMHLMEVTNLGSVTFAQMTATATACLRVGCKQTAC